MRAVLSVALVCFVSSLVYCAEPERGETPRAKEVRANFDQLASEDQALKKEALDYFRSVDKAFAAEVPLFTALLKDERYRVRAISAFALGKIGQAAAGSIPEVGKLLTDSSATVQKYAKQALERLKPFKSISEEANPEETPLPQKPRASTPTPDAVIDAIKELGGVVKIDKNGAVVSVDFYGTKVTDAELEHLEGLTNLQTLNLLITQTTDAGLEHLTGLTKLQMLNLAGTKITDAGLVHLKGLNNLTNLSLTVTKVTDAGLVHLKGLTKLEMLDLDATKVTDAGVKELQQALPKCQVHFRQ
jgi:hypothetical protein